jgi:hypothetical protein
MPPLIPFVAAAAGTVVLVRFLRSEWRRVNDELDRVQEAEERPAPAATLKRDPRTGDWRAGQ